MYEQNGSTLLLNYYRQRQVKPGWQDLVQVIFSGIFTSAEDKDGREFLQMIGRQLAQKHPLPRVATVGELEDRLNMLLAQFDWGIVSIEASEWELMLIHHAYPCVAQSDEQPRWITAFAAVLCGAYAEWLLGQGGTPGVPLRWQNSGTENTLVFIYRNS